MKNFIFLFISYISSSVPLLSQSFSQPNIGLKSHETLDITKAEVKPEATVFYLGIENRIDGGNFCADRNIFIITPDGEKIKMESSSGICQSGFEVPARDEQRAGHVAFNLAGPLP